MRESSHVATIARLRFRVADRDATEMITVWAYHHAGLLAVGSTVASSVHQLKITLRSVRPPVWRRILVGSDMSLGELARVLEAAMGWLGGHLHVFDVKGTWYGSADPDWDSNDLDEDKYRLSEVLAAGGDKMRWNYDFGDGWEHDVLVEKIADADPGVEYPLCLAGRRACPPEDCGGPSGYAELLKAFADLSHPDHEELRRWAPPGFDPASFDVEDVNHSLRSPRLLEGW